MATPIQGNAVIGQSGGPTCVINQSLVGAILEAARHDTIDNVYGARHGIQGMLSQDFLDLSANSNEALEQVANTPSAALGSVRMKPTRDDCRNIFKVFRQHDVRYFFYIGGNDSAETAHIVRTIAEEDGYDLRVAHIPKTIDNDLRVTDHCPGYGSAARFVALALMGDNLDNAALRGVKINVIMGRHAGFLTAAAGLARQAEDDGPHLIYVPEAPFDLDDFCERVNGCIQKIGRCVVAASEGIQDKDGNPILTTGEKDSHGNVQLSGTGALGDFLAATLKDRLKLSRVRADTYGYLQRSSPSIISDVDAREARAVGVRAVQALATGEVESASVAIGRKEGATYEAEYFLTELKNMARETRDLPKEYFDAANADITPAFVEYAAPLVGELPTIGRLADQRVPQL